MIFFDYIFYRIAKAYYKREGTDAFTASLLVGAMQATIICDIVLIIVRFFYSRQETSQHVTSIKYAAGIVIICLIILNYSKYKNRYAQFSERFSTSNELPTILIFLIALTPLFLLILLGIYT
jgi:riboflavin transporter FmnP